MMELLRRAEENATNDRTTKNLELFQNNLKYFWENADLASVVVYIEYLIDSNNGIEDLITYLKYTCGIKHIDLEFVVTVLQQLILRNPECSVAIYKEQSTAVSTLEDVHAMPLDVTNPFSVKMRLSDLYDRSRFGNSVSLETILHTIKQSSSSDVPTMQVFGTSYDISIYKYTRYNRYTTPLY